MTIQRELLASCWTWAGDVGPGEQDERSPVPLRERIDAVAAAGWSGVGLSHADLQQYRADIGLPRLKTWLDAAGLHRVELEFLDDWWADGDSRVHSDQIRDDLLSAAHDLEVDVIKVGACPVRPDLAAPPAEAFAASFDQLADHAHGYGVDIALEAMGHTNLSTFGAAVDLVRSVANPHGGLAVDAYHLSRTGDADFAALPRVLQGVPVFVVELGDARIDRTQLGNPVGHGVGPRCLPGEGDIDMASFIASMWTAGWRGHWGVEIISADLRRLPVGEGVARVHRSIQRALDSADVIVARHA